MASFKIDKAIHDFDRHLDVLKVVITIGVFNARIGELNTVYHSC